MTTMITLRIPKSYPKSFGEPNHIIGIKVMAIAKNQKQKLTLGKRLLSNSCTIWDASSKYTVPAPNRVN